MKNVMIDLINYLFESMFLFLILITGIVFAFVGTIFWFICYPLFTIIDLIYNFKKTQDTYKCDLKYWIGSLNVIDLILITTYIVSLWLYSSIKTEYNICLYINIISLVLWSINRLEKVSYFADKSKFNLPYINFTEKPKFIKSKIYDIIKYDLYQYDIDILKELITNVKIVSYYEIKDNDDLRSSIYRLKRCQFIVEDIIDAYEFKISLNKNLLPYIKEL